MQDEIPCFSCAHRCIKSECTSNKYCQYTGLPWIQKLLWENICISKWEIAIKFCSLSGICKYFKYFFCYFLFVLLFLGILHNIHKHRISVVWVFISNHYSPKVWMDLELEWFSSPSPHVYLDFISARGVLNQWNKISCTKKETHLPKQTKQRVVWEKSNKCVITTRNRPTMLYEVL